MPDHTPPPTGPDADLIERLRADFHLASLGGPAGGLEYLRRRMAAPLPRNVLREAYTLRADAQARMNDWDGCSASVAKALELDSGEGMEIQPEDFAADAAGEEPKAASGSPRPIAAPIKLCRQCGADVRHKGRRKNPVTGEYLCVDCYHALRDKRQSRKQFRRWAIRVALILALVAIVSALILAEVLG